MLKGEQIFFIGQEKIDNLQKLNPRAYQLIRNLSHNNKCFYLNPYGSYLKGLTRFFSFSDQSEYEFDSDNKMKVVTIYKKLSESIYHPDEFYNEQSNHIRNVLNSIQKKYKFYKPIVISFDRGSMFNQTINQCFVDNGSFQYIDKNFAEKPVKKNKKYDIFLAMVDAFIFDRFQIEDIIDTGILVGDKQYAVLQESIDYGKYSKALNVNNSIPNDVTFCVPFNLTRDLVDVKLFQYIYNQFPANKWFFYSQKIDGVFRKFLKKKNNYEIIDTTKSNLVNALGQSKFIVLPFPTSVRKEFAEQIILKCLAAGLEVASTQFDGYEYSDSRFNLFDQDTTRYNKSNAQEFVNYMKNKIIMNQPAKAMQRTQLAKEYGWENTLDVLGKFISHFKNN